MQSPVVYSINKSKASSSSSGVVDDLILRFNERGYCFNRKFSSRLITDALFDNSLPEEERIHAFVVIRHLGTPTLYSEVYSHLWMGEFNDYGILLIGYDPYRSPVLKARYLEELMNQVPSSLTWAVSLAFSMIGRKFVDSSLDFELNSNL